MILAKSQPLLRLARHPCMVLRNLILLDPNSSHMVRGMHCCLEPKAKADSLLRDMGTGLAANSNLPYMGRGDGRPTDVQGEMAGALQGDRHKFHQMASEVPHNFRSIEAWWEKAPQKAKYSFYCQWGSHQGTRSWSSL